MSLTDAQVTYFHDVFLKIAVRGIAYGISVILGGVSIFTLLRQGLHGSKSRLLLISILFIMFLCSTGIIVVTIISSLADVRSVGQTPYDDTALQLKTYIVTAVLSRINYFLSDGVVIWRAFVLFPRRSIFRLILILSLLVCWAAAIIDCVFVIIAGVTGVLQPQSRYLVLLLPMLFTNFLATLLITWRTWYYQHFEHVQGSSAGKQIKSALFLLVESGSVYCIILILCTISIQPGSLPMTGQSVLAGLFPHLSAIYPTLIIVLMSMQDIKASPGETVLSRSLQLSEANTSDGSDTVQSLVVPFSPGFASEMSPGLKKEMA
ncbi:hypothetical protein K435DRAFT_843712 [Dendrothele bispora CBS 962.96]|uniref:G-protein coupled receptors family 1 profile domain-containing protein n=1 Tax=Dendrothele bispora (strain CBS 962.96) TaxID=1314807 RepID=A0A4S8L6T5_DENBC|nr:hypothetical protein K435DRAFT_843712 [Dendrothele bispora CBS 962.96]